MKRLMILCSLAALSLTFACGGKQKKNEAPVTDAAQPPAPEAATPTCGGWLVVVEQPVVPAGGFNADGLRRALLDGLASGGCTAQTTLPAAGAASVLKISLKASSVGTGGVIMMMATDANTGELKWRFQEKVASGVDGTGAASGLGLKIATALGG